MRAASGLSAGQLRFVVQLNSASDDYEAHSSSNRIYHESRDLGTFIVSALISFARRLLAKLLYCSLLSCYGCIVAWPKQFSALAELDSIQSIGIKKHLNCHGMMP